MYTFWVIDPTPTSTTKQTQSTLHANAHATPTPNAHAHAQRPRPTPTPTSKLSTPTPNAHAHAQRPHPTPNAQRPHPLCATCAPNTRTPEEPSRSAVVRARDSNRQDSARQKKIFGRRGQWSVGAPGGARTDDIRRFDVVSEFGRRIDPHHLFGARIARRVWLHVKQQAQTVLASSSAADYKKLDLFLRVCLDASNDAIEKLSMDRLLAGTEM